MGARFLLGADIGGTFSRFALFRLEESAAGLTLSLVPQSKIKLATHDYASFTQLLKVLQSKLDPQQKIAGAVMAVPGPVEGGHCRASNIPWELDRLDIEAVFGVPAGLINDFAAQAHACLFPELLGLHCILSGEAKADSPVALVGAGTGLGSALLLPDSSGQTQKFYAGDSNEGAAQVTLPAALLSPEALLSMRRRVLASEGGHAVFGFVGEDEAAFEAFMRSHTGRAEVIGDMAVTGHGLAMLHAFHTGFSALLPPEEVSKVIDKHPIVMEWFARFYGRACRNFALSTLSLGGVYLSGGMLSHVPGLLGHPAFVAEFLFSETKAYLLKDIPVFWVSNQDAGLWGSAMSALHLIAL